MNMLDELLNMLSYYNAENGFIMNPEVPREEEHYARAALDIPDESYVIMSIRTSFTKFHKGMVICDDGLYWRNSHKVETDVTHLSWKEMSERKEQFNGHRAIINFGGDTNYDHSGSLNKARDMINFLDLIIDLYRKQDGEEIGFKFHENDAKEKGLIRDIPYNKAELKRLTEEAEVDIAQISFSNVLSDIVKKIFKVK